MGAIGNREQQTLFAGLSDLQRLFVAAYGEDLNATRAARRAGYRHPNVAGAKLLRSPRIRQAIRYLLQPKLDEIDLSTDAILLQLRRALFRDLTPFFDRQGRPICEPGDLPEDLRQVIDQWDVERSFDKRSGALVSERIRVRCVSKEFALAKALEYVGLIGPSRVKNSNKSHFDWQAFYAEAQQQDVDVVGDQIMESTNGRPNPEVNGDSGAWKDGTGKF